MEREFGYSYQDCSKILKLGFQLVYNKIPTKLEFDRNLVLRNLANYCTAVHHKSQGAIDNCFGFIDGTARHICRPFKVQEAAYNGHKRYHAIKFQSIVTPDGFCVSMFGPVEGRRHDATLLKLSGVSPYLG
mmetsp:Transcript_37787/g.48702  ORF Transcript_37787/g.48702 Transcript_37787/m.48702 type:complete len:131 (+) Transcript_37787:202-594(+)